MIVLHHCDNLIECYVARAYRPYEMGCHIQRDGQAAFSVLENLCTGLLLIVQITLIGY